jgi:hypothetical protein
MEMASEIGSFSQSLEVSETNVQSSITDRTHPRTATETWSHARSAQGDEAIYEGPNKILYCRHCPANTTYKSSITTNFRRHLRAKHQINIQARVPIVRKKAEEQIQLLYQTLSSQGHQSALDQSVINEALVTLVVVRGLSFNILQWPEFHAFCIALNPESQSAIYMSSSALTTLIQESFSISKDIVRRTVQSAISSIHISLDVWTSPNRYLLLGVCAHFVDRTQEKPQKALLGLRTIQGHSGNEQFNALQPLLDDYGILSKLGSVIGDNASTNDVLCRTIQTHLQTKGIAWDSIERRVRCTGHIINLAVQAFIFYNCSSKTFNILSHDASYDESLEQEEIQQTGRASVFRKMGALGKLHNIVIHMRSSSARTKAIEDLAGRTIPLDNQTRWNSWYQMLDVALEKEKAVIAYIKDHINTLEDDRLTPIEWRTLRTIRNFLHPFYRATKATEGDASMIDSVLYTMDILIKWYEEQLKEIKKDSEFHARIL